MAPEVVAQVALLFEKTSAVFETAEVDDVVLGVVPDPNHLVPVTRHAKILFLIPVPHTNVPSCSFFLIVRFIQAPKLELGLVEPLLAVIVK